MTNLIELIEKDATNGRVRGVAIEKRDGGESRPLQVITPSAKYTLSGERVVQMDFVHDYDSQVKSALIDLTESATAPGGSNEFLITVFNYAKQPPILSHP